MQRHRAALYKRHAPVRVCFKSQPEKMYLLTCVPNIGIKHGFSCINIRQVPWEVLKTEAEDRCFQHLPRDRANVNALKNHVRSLLLHRNRKHLLHLRYLLHYFVSPFHRCRANDISTDYARSGAGQYTSRDGSNYVAPVQTY